jgi:hypothetical protein
VTAASGFCSRCGAARPTADRFCSKCGLDFWQAAAGQVQPAPTDGGIAPAASPPIASAPSQQANNILRLIAGLAWLLAAALTGYLAFLQLQFSAATEGRLGNEAMSLAITNGISAAITVFFGAKLLMAPSRRFLFNSAAWAALSVTWAVIQIMQGVTADVFIMATVASAVAGILSLVAAIQRTGGA